MSWVYYFFGAQTDERHLVVDCKRDIQTKYTVSQKKLDPFLFEHNFDKYCPILIILSLLQTEINLTTCIIKSTTIPQIG